MELFQKLSISFAVGSGCDDIAAFASVSAYRDSVESLVSLCREEDKRDKTRGVSLRAVFSGLVGCRSCTIGNRDRGRVDERSRFVSSSRSW